jgi:hypothetical protein
MKNRKYVNIFEYWHNNPPPPFNPDFDPKAKDRGRAVATSMEADGFYENHTREECAAEYRRRYELRQQQGD